MLPTTAFVLQISRDMNRIRRADHQALLFACRQLIATRANYSGYAWRLPYDPSATNAYYLGERDILTNNIADGIRNLRPKSLVIYKDWVLINTRSPRYSVLAFAEGANQFGTEKLIDGLWFWNGKRSDRKYGEMLKKEETTSDR